MRVKELLELLKDCDPEAQVVTYYVEFNYGHSDEFPSTSYQSVARVNKGFVDNTYMGDPVMEWDFDFTETPKNEPTIGDGAAVYLEAYCDADNKADRDDSIRNFKP